MKIFLPSSLRRNVEEKITYSHELYAKEVLPRIHGIANPDKKMLELCLSLDFEYQLEAVYLLLGERIGDNVLITGARFFGYKFNAHLGSLKLELEPVQEGSKPVGVLHSHPLGSGFSEDDLGALPLLENELGGWGCIMMLYDEKERNYIAIDTSARRADIFWYDEAS